MRRAGHPVGDAEARYFAAADAARFRWMAEDPAFAPVEDALLEPHLAALPFPCLEVGCGEGSNLRRLARHGRPVGVDLYPDRVRFAAAAVPGARCAVADALRLPFTDGAFRSVLVRDLLHHVPAPARAVAEAVRVLAPGGTLLVLEPNGRNPLAALQARLIRAEARIRDFTPEHVVALLADLPLEPPRLDMAQAFPLRRLVLHYRFGLPALGRRRAIAAALAAIERLGERLLPPSRWSYVVARARRRSS
jgi:SAM-dependent methyltransferase